jgi:hypothetical protein
MIAEGEECVQGSGSPAGRSCGNAGARMVIELSPRASRRPAPEGNAGPMPPHPVSTMRPPRAATIGHAT